MRIRFLEIAQLELDEAVEYYASAWIYGSSFGPPNVRVR